MQPNSRDGTTDGIPRFVVDDLYAAPGDDKSDGEFNEKVRGDVFRGRRVEPAAERRKQEKRDGEYVRKVTGMPMNDKTTPAGFTSSGKPPVDTGKAERDAKAAERAEAEAKAKAPKLPEKTDEQKANEKARAEQEKAPKGICQFCHGVADANSNTCAEHALPPLEEKGDKGTA